MDLDDLAIVVTAPVPVPAAFPPCNALTRLLLAAVAALAHAALADGALPPSLSLYPWPMWSAHPNTALTSFVHVMMPDRWRVRGGEIVIIVVG
jgi:hypothetical protein